MKKPIAMFFMLLALSCSSCGTSPKLSFDEVSLNDNSSKFTITSDLDQWSAMAGSVELGCHLAQLTVDRGYQYYYMDQKSRGTETDSRPSFRLTFYNMLPEGMSVVNPMSAIVYNGEWADRYDNGRGTMFYPDGARYEGEWVAGKPQGHGVMITRYGDRYEGEWRNGKQHGHGSMTWRYGDKYEGEWRNGKQNGHGLMIWSYGDRYEGEWSDDYRHGKGKITSSNGASYEGEWVNGSITGHGIFITPDGERYESDFYQGVGTVSSGEFIKPKDFFGTKEKRDLYSYGPHRDSAVKEAHDSIVNSAFDAKAEGFLDLCKEARSRISQQQKLYLDLSPR